MPTTKVRHSITLDEDDVVRIENIRADDVLHDILVTHAGTKAHESVAAMMHALVVCGMELLEREADERRYEQLAACQDDEDRSFHAAMRGRRQER